MSAVVSSFESQLQNLVMETLKSQSLALSKVPAISTRQHKWEEIGTDHKMQHIEFNLLMDKVYIMCSLAREGH